MRSSAPDSVAAALREAILDGRLDAGARLREVELAEEHGVARHTVRAALRALEAEGLVTIEPNRGARVATLDPSAIVGLYELRTALEVEAAHLALARHAGRMPRAVHEAAERLAAAGRARDASWEAASVAHAAVHAAIVRAARSPRIARAHAALENETRLFLLQVRPHGTLDELAADHLRLVADLERVGPDALREHLRAAAAALVDEVELAG